MPVKPIGPLNAKIAVVGEAPGREEDRMGMPFVGSAGKILNQMLEDAGITRGECYITNVMNIRPNDNDFGQFYEDKSRKKPIQELLDGYVRLQEEIRSVAPNVIIALGNEALKALTGITGITKYRGSILSWYDEVTDNHFKVVSTIHPAAVMRNWEQRPLVIMDLARAKEESTSPGYNEMPRLWTKVGSIEELRTRIKNSLKAEYLSFDIETCNNQISCIGFATSSDTAYTIPIAMYDKSYWTPEQELEVWSLIKQLLESNIKKIAQNANFDMLYLYKTVGIKTKNLWMDTMNAHHTIYPELPKGLDTLCSIYTKQPYYKDMIRDNIYKYNCLDAMVTYECAMAIEKELKEFGTHNFYHTYANYLIEPLLDMQIRGVKIDVKKRALAAEEMKKQIEEDQKKLNSAVGYDINVMSPTQMKNFLYSDLGFPLKTNRKTGKVTTNEGAIQALARAHPNPVFDIILKIRENRKLLSTYLEAPIDDDGRFRCSYLLSGTESGRISSRTSAFGTGGNLQNVPKGICREVFVPDEGMIFISADLSQAEARIVAYLAKEDRLIDIFERGGDVHAEVAASIFNKEIDAVTKEERNLAKRIVHASNYMMGPRQFAELIGISSIEAQNKLNTYHVTFPRIRLWHMEIERLLKRTRILETPMGRKRMFFGRWGNELLRDAISYIPQSTVADVTLTGMLNIYRELPDNCNLVFNIHDEIVIQAPIAFADAMQKLMVKCMSVPVDVDGKDVIIPVNTSVGMNWNEV